MNTNKKHWWEIGRVKNSDWFRRLPSMEQAAVLEALEYDTHESAAKLRATLAFAYSTAVYAAAVAVWSMVFRYHVLWFGLAGAAIGALLGLLSANAIATQKTPKEASAMQATTGLVVGLPGAIVAIMGLVVWLIKATIIH